MSHNRVVRGKSCPECGGTIVYNGNYFCSTDDQVPNGCGWAMGERRTDADLDIIETYLRQELAYYEKRGDIDNVSRMHLYLNNIAAERRAGGRGR